MKKLSGTKTQHIEKMNREMTGFRRALDHLDTRDCKALWRRLDNAQDSLAHVHAHAYETNLRTPITEAEQKMLDAGARRFARDCICNNQLSGTRKRKARKR